MSFLIKNDELLETYKEIWGKVSKVIKFDSEPVYNEKYLKDEIKSYEEKLNTYFHDDNVPKEGSQYVYLSASLIKNIRELGMMSHGAMDLFSFRLPFVF